MKHKFVVPSALSILQVQMYNHFAPLPTSPWPKSTETWSALVVSECSLGFPFYSFCFIVHTGTDVQPFCTITNLSMTKIHRNIKWYQSVLSGFLFTPFALFFHTGTDVQPFCTITNLSMTKIHRNMKWYQSVLSGFLFTPFAWMMMSGPNVGAQNTIHCALTAEIDDRTSEDFSIFQKWVQIVYRPNVGGPNVGAQNTIQCVLTAEIDDRTSEDFSIFQKWVQIVNIYFGRRILSISCFHFPKVRCFFIYCHILRNKWNISNIPIFFQQDRSGQKDLPLIWFN